MNLGIYVNGFENREEIESICSYLNHCIDNRLVQDASLFYNNIGFNPYALKCGAFNSTDIWNFHGVLVCTSIDCIVNAKKIVNNLNLVYFYGWEEKPSLIHMLTIIDNKVKLICRSPEESEYIKRVMNRHVNIVPNKFENLIQAISGD